MFLVLTFIELIYRLQVAGVILTPQEKETMKNNVRYAGVSVVNGNEFRFHTRSSSKTCLWVKLPSHSLFNFIKVPKKTRKVKAAMFLFQHERFKGQQMQKFLQTQIERRQANLPANPRNVIIPKSRVSRQIQRINGRSNGRIAA